MCLPKGVSILVAEKAEKNGMNEKPMQEGLSQNGDSLYTRVLQILCSSGMHMEIPFV